MRLDLCLIILAKIKIPIFADIYQLNIFKRLALDLLADRPYLLVIAKNVCLTTDTQIPYTQTSILKDS